jgi:mutual gliding-motility protein MglA
LPVVNYESRELTCKIVYYGPGRSGKTTNLQHVYSQLPEDRKGKMVSLATETDRTLFFDFLPLDLGSISGFSTRFQLYTVPGQVYYEATRRLVLQGVDGVVFVADSQRSQVAENIESFQDLHGNLAELGLDPRSVPMVMQYNKRDLDYAALTPITELERLLNFRDAPSFSASAIDGGGVFETLRAIASRVLSKLSGPARSAPARAAAR